VFSTAIHNSNSLQLRRIYMYGATSRWSLYTKARCRRWFVVLVLKKVFGTSTTSYLGLNMKGEKHIHVKKQRTLAWHVHSINGEPWSNSNLKHSWWETSQQLIFWSKPWIQTNCSNWQSNVECAMDLKIACWPNVVDERITMPKRGVNWAFLKNQH
jgi:hypothetical protein